VALRSKKLEIRKNNTQSNTLVEKVECHVDLLENSRPLTNRLLMQIPKATEEDSILQEAINYTRHRWPIGRNSVYRVKFETASRNEFKRTTFVKKSHCHTIEMKFYGTYEGISSTCKVQSNSPGISLVARQQTGYSQSHKDMWILPNSPSISTQRTIEVYPITESTVAENCWRSLQIR
jgi:hypothetical protein